MNSDELLSKDRYVVPLLVLLSLLVLLPGNGTVPLWDRDEPRFAEAASEMLQTGNFLVPYFNEEYRFDKPVLIYWVMAGAYYCLGVNEFSARLGSVLAMTVSCLLLFALGKEMMSRRAGILGAIVWITSLAVSVVGRAATADSLLNLFIILSLYGLWKTLDGTPRTWPFLLFYAGLALGSLTKGPVALLPAAVGCLFMIIHNRKLGIVLCTSFFVLGAGLWHLRFLVLGGEPEPGSQTIPLFIGWILVTTGLLGLFLLSLRIERRHIWGSLLFLCIVALWLVPAWVQTNGEVIRVGLGHHVINRSLHSSFEGHSGPFVYHLGLLPVTFFPWILFLPTSVVFFLKTKILEDRKRTFLLLCCLLPFLLFSSIKTKLPHYVLPAFPALSLLVGCFLDHYMREREPPPTNYSLWTGLILFIIICVAAGVGLPVALVLTGFSKHLPAAIPVSILMLLMVYLVTRNTLAGRMHVVFLSLAGGILLTFVCIMGYTLPGIAGDSLSKQVPERISELIENDETLCCAGYCEPSLVFYTHRQLHRVISPIQLLERVQRGERILFVAKGGIGELFLYNSNLAPLVTKLDSVSGYNFAKGKWQDVSIYRVESNAQGPSDTSSPSKPSY